MVVSITLRNEICREAVCSAITSVWPSHSTTRSSETCDGDKAADEQDIHEYQEPAEWFRPAVLEE